MTPRVYFIRVQPSGPIKIGITSNDPADRIDALQVGCPWPLKLMGTIEGSYGNESFLHDKFAVLRMAGEWFEPAPELLLAIDEMLAPGFQWPTVGDPSFAAIIDLFGRSADFADAIGIPESHARAMRARRSIPGHYWIRMVEAAKARGLVGITLEVLAGLAEASLERSASAKAEVSQ